jgi:hypothetical protein
VLDMGPTPDCAVILGTPWLASLGDYTCNEHKGTLSFWQQGKRSHQKVVLKSRDRLTIARQHGDLSRLETTFKQAKAGMQRAKRKGFECAKVTFQMGNDNSDQSPLVEMANSLAKVSCIQTESLVTADGTAVRLMVDWDRPHLAVVEFVAKQEDMFSGNKGGVSEVRLKGLSAQNCALEGRCGRVCQTDGWGKLVVELEPEHLGGETPRVRVSLNKLM